MSRGTGKVEVDLDKVLKLRISGGDLTIRQSDDEYLYFETEDRHFYLNSHSDEKNIYIEVGKVRPFSGKKTYLSDLEIEIPQNAMVDIDLLYGDVSVKSISLKSFNLSLRKGDANFDNLLCNDARILLTRGDLMLNGEVKNIFIKNVNGDVDAVFSSSKNIIIDSTKGDVLLHLREEPKSIKTRCALGDCQINGKFIAEVEGNGQCRVNVTAVKGDIDILYPENNKSISYKDEDREGGNENEIKKILEMLKDKKITRDEAKKLLDSLNAEKEVF